MFEPALRIRNPEEQKKKEQNQIIYQKKLKCVLKGTLSVKNREKFRKHDPDPRTNGSSTLV